MGAPDLDRLWKSLAPLAFVTRLRKDTRRTLEYSQHEVRRADERGLRYKAYVTTTPRRCSSLDLELKRTKLARLRTPCNFFSTDKFGT